MNMINRIALKIAREYIYAMAPAPLNTQGFIERSIDVWGQGKFDYSKVDYKNNKTYVELKCIQHNNWFRQKPKEHLEGKSGCQDCQKISRGERKFKQLLNQHQISYVTQKKFNPDEQTKKKIREQYHFRIEKAPYDFCIQNENGKFLIQIQGEQHWDQGALLRISHGQQTLETRIMIDKGKKQFAESQGYVVLQIPNVPQQQIDNIPPEIKKSYCNSNEEAILIIMGSLEYSE